jgi:hypothetical protein
LGVPDEDYSRNASYALNLIEGWDSIERSNPATFFCVGTWPEPGFPLFLFRWEVIVLLIFRWKCLPSLRNCWTYTNIWSDFLWQDVTVSSYIFKSSKHDLIRNIHVIYFSIYLQNRVSTTKVSWINRRYARFRLYSKIIRFFTFFLCSSCLLLNRTKMSISILSMERMSSILMYKPYFYLNKWDAFNFIKWCPESNS